MNTLTDIKPIQSDMSDRTITLSLTLHPSNLVYVRSCEVLGKGFRNRTSFQENKLVEDVLVARLSKAIMSSLRALSDGAHVLSLPDFLIELPGLVLSGAHLMVMKTKGGVRNAIMRFKDFMGSISNAFRLDIGFQEPYSSHSEKLAINVLAEVCLPILNLCRNFEELNFGNDRGKALNIADRAREFEFQTELLKRFIFNAGIGHAQALEAHLHEDLSERSMRIS